MGCEDPYEEWYAERSADSAGSLVEQERERQEAQRRQTEINEEVWRRSLPSEKFPSLGSLDNEVRMPKRAGEVDRGEFKRPRP